MPDIQTWNHTNIDVFISSKSVHKLNKTIFKKEWGTGSLGWPVCTKAFLVSSLSKVSYLVIFHRLPNLQDALNAVEIITQNLNQQSLISVIRGRHKGVEIWKCRFDHP